MTPELRADVMVPGWDSASSSSTSRPASVRARATARPTTPAPTTTHSTRSAIYSIYHANTELPARPARLQPFCGSGISRLLVRGQPLFADQGWAARPGDAARRDLRDRWSRAAGAAAEGRLHRAGAGT